MTGYNALAPPTAGTYAWMRPFRRQECTDKASASNLCDLDDRLRTGWPGPRVGSGDWLSFLTPINLVKPARDRCGAASHQWAVGRLGYPRRSLMLRRPQPVGLGETAGLGGTVGVGGEGGGAAGDWATAVGAEDVAG
jgi:hypothetical protein